MAFGTCRQTCLGLAPASYSCSSPTRARSRMAASIRQVALHATHVTSFAHACPGQVPAACSAIKPVF
eukprot:38457-Chlamydomonas_euryale.AAC.10